MTSKKKIIQEFLSSTVAKEKALTMLKNEDFKDIWGQALTLFLFRNGPVETMHSKGQLSQGDMEVLNKYMMNRAVGIIDMMYKDEWYMLYKILEPYIRLNSKWDKADLSELDIEKSIVIKRMEDSVDTNDIVDDPLTEREFLDISYSSKLDEDLGIINYNAEIQLVNTDTDNSRRVGKAIFNYYNLEEFSDWEEVLYCADGDSGDDLEVLSHISAYMEDEIPFGKVALLKVLKIDKLYRGKKIGTEAIHQFIHYWRLCGMDFLAVKPAPLDLSMSQKDREEYISRLIIFYKQFGFNVIEYKKLSEPVMILEFIEY